MNLYVFKQFLKIYVFSIKWKGLGLGDGQDRERIKRQINTVALGLFKIVVDRKKK